MNNCVCTSCGFKHEKPPVPKLTKEQAEKILEDFETSSDIGVTYPEFLNQFKNKVNAMTE
jgi:hypothetical protein